MRRLETARIRVVRPGLLTTVQDLGRFGFRRFGMPVGGAMDTVALRLANRLVGNPDQAAALEMTLKGPELVFDTDAVIALTGADLTPLINHEPVPLWTALEVARGSALSWDERRSGARAYLAVAGGIDVPLVLGSRSTHIASRTGGFAGRALARGDTIVGGPPASDPCRLIGCAIPMNARPSYSQAPVLRVVLGPQMDCFANEAVETLVRGQYIVTPQSDRMGYRLNGPPLVHEGSPEIVSDATPQGSVQVPASQQPILLMADCQTTGGYPKIAVVISADLPLAAQLLPEDTVRFSLIEVREAQVIAREQRAKLEAAVPCRSTTSTPGM
jgi:antagonist of KipI